jgi:hypothetical protein
MTDHILTIFKLLQGVKRILTLNKQHITLQLFTQGPFWQKDFTTTLDASTSIAFERPAYLNQSESESESKSKSNAPEQTLTSANFITYLRHYFMKFACARQAKIPRLPLHGWALWIWSLLRVPGGERGFRCWFWLTGFLLNELDGERWRARGAGRALVDEVMGVLEGEKASTSGEWEECLGWVRERMGVSASG